MFQRIAEIIQDFIDQYLPHATDQDPSHAAEAECYVLFRIDPSGKPRVIAGALGSHELLLDFAKNHYHITYPGSHHPLLWSETPDAMDDPLTDNPTEYRAYIDMGDYPTEHIFTLSELPLIN